MFSVSPEYPTLSKYNVIPKVDHSYIYDHTPSNITAPSPICKHNTTYSTAKTLSLRNPLGFCSSLYTFPTSSPISWSGYHSLTYGFSLSSTFSLISFIATNSGAPPCCVLSASSILAWKVCLSDDFSLWR